MKIAKKYLRDLEDILSDMQRAKKYLMREDVAGIAHTVNPKHANGGNYTINNMELAKPNDHSVLMPACVTVCNKNVGSDIVGLYHALSKLTRLIDELSDDEV